MLCGSRETCFVGVRRRRNRVNGGAGQAETGECLERLRSVGVAHHRHWCDERYVVAGLPARIRERDRVIHLATVIEHRSRSAGASLHRQPLGTEARAGRRFCGDGGQPCCDRESDQRHGFGTEAHGAGDAHRGRMISGHAVDRARARVSVRGDELLGLRERAVSTRDRHDNRYSSRRQGPDHSGGGQPARIVVLRWIVDVFADQRDAPVERVGSGLPEALEVTTPGPWGTNVDEDQRRPGNNVPETVGHAH